MIVLASPPSALAVDNGLGRTPVMGFNDWNAFGCNVSAALIEQTADYLVSSGLAADGYKYVDIDDCWMANARVDGHLVADSTKFPDGIEAVADYVHADGLKLGIYESAGATTCQGYPGSLGHETTDADDFAGWGVDLLKYDNCGTTSADTADRQAYIDRYTAMADALANSGRSILYSICEWGNESPWEWAPSIGNQWRTTTDISDSYASMLSNMAQNAQLAAYAGPGAFNDPDMLEIGNGGMTDAEYKSEFSLWAVMAAPLIAGTDLRSASSETLAIYGNKDVIKVDQDSLGEQGELLSDTDGKYIFAKPLSNGDVAVAMFNSTDTGTSISTTAKAAGSARASIYRLKDLWSKDTTESAGRIHAYVPAHATVMYRLHAVTTNAGFSRAMALPAHTGFAVTSPSSTVASGGRTTVRVALVNDGWTPVRLNDEKLTLPKGWQVVPISRSARGTFTWHGRHARRTESIKVSTNESAVTRFRAFAPAASALFTSSEVDAAASYNGIGGNFKPTASTTLTLYAPLSSAYSTANTTGSDALFAQHDTALGIDAAGTGVNPAQSGFITRAASDQYGAIYSPGSLGSSGTVEATITAHHDATGFTANSATGIMVRNDETASSASPEGVVLYLNGRGVPAMAWAAQGGSTVDTTAGGGGPGVTAPSLPVTLKLVRDGDSYTGSYSTDGTTWTTVGTATLPDSAAATPQDAGVFHTSGSSSPTEADFTDFAVR